MENKDWLKKQSKQKQIDVYGRAYDLMTLRQAYHGENLTVDEAITRIRETVLCDDVEPLVDKELHYIEDVISALKKIDSSDCTDDVWETIQDAIEDLNQCV